jgi:hypothetical protein
MKENMKAIFSKDITVDVKRPSPFGYINDEYTINSRTTTIRLFGIKISEKRELFLHPYEDRE